MGYQKKNFIELLGIFYYKKNFCQKNKISLNSFFCFIFEINNYKIFIFFIEILTL